MKHTRSLGHTYVQLARDLPCREGAWIAFVPCPGLNTQTESAPRSVFGGRGISNLEASPGRVGHDAYIRFISMVFFLRRYTYTYSAPFGRKN